MKIEIIFEDGSDTYYNGSKIPKIGDSIQFPEKEDETIITYYVVGVNWIIVSNEVKIVQVFVS